MASCLRILILKSSHSEDVLEMSLTETEHGKDLEALADRLIKNYDSKVSKLLDEKLDKLNVNSSQRDLVR